MCGIVGYIGHRQASSFLLDGLRRLEYRGYDSAGVGVLENDTLAIRKTAGRIDNLVSLLTENPIAGHNGIGHTRWATHGAATEVNSHPHVGGNQVLAIGHDASHVDRLS